MSSPQITVLCSMCQTGKRGRKPHKDTTAWHRERQLELGTGEPMAYVCPACARAKADGREVTVIGRCPITGAPLIYRDVGPRPKFATQRAERLSAAIDRVRRLVGELLDAGDRPRGAFSDRDIAKAVARRLNLPRNQIFNACRADEAYDRRLAAQQAAQESTS